MSIKKAVVRCVINLEIDITGTALSNYQLETRAKEIAKEAFSDYDMAVEHVKILVEEDE